VKCLLGKALTDPQLGNFLKVLNPSSGSNEASIDMELQGLSKDTMVFGTG
jgi:hypothetical protein